MYLRAQGSQHAAAAGIGHGEYSAMIANFRCEQATNDLACLRNLRLFPLAAERSVLCSRRRDHHADAERRIYTWSTSGAGSKLPFAYPGLAYIFNCLFDVAAEVIFRSMSKDDIENPKQQD